MKGRIKMFGLFSRKDINKGVENWKSSPNAVLLDVRTPQEYNDRHIDGSVNIPLDSLDLIADRIPDKGTPLFVHCLSGARSAQAVSYLRKIGYSDVHDIGGINSYRGETV